MYHNPVKVVETDSWVEKCKEVQESLGIHEPLVVTSPGNLRRQKLPTVFNPNSIFSNIAPNPTFESCQDAIYFSNRVEFDGLIAIGGGSVMDTAKIILAASGTGKDTIEHVLRFTDSFPKRVSSIFVPTTHGTGSEVTMWGTIWNIKEKKKYSISNPNLYPDIAILDGSLTLSLPLDISISTLLDALSHSFEAIWNKNRNPKSTDFAIQAICLILENVEKLKHDLKNREARSKLLKAANIAGLAFSNTKTAAAHSISYPLTINFQVPHGIASSLAILPLLEINHSEIEGELGQLLKQLNMKGLSELSSRIKEIPSNVIKYTLQDWGVQKNQLEELVTQSFTKGRMDNNIVELTEEHVWWILNEIYS